ncbi:hypothetical protein PC118_g11234 [Phytophthora cactorum]|uniref:Uncharacterized protein n=1 Tax=Phytophthora cactorum TaxID=29920 RepID=A0A8T1FQ46_9STRA|nr:hypothetical protein PC117_g12014 [Phytophthora cactorum]KAG2980355.1 hypothetical protein PC118_g11234 [Phytophthora cactorum]KAG3017644.1 hypothetical protein PC120_g10917 [Phytophthora cactorum]
MSKAKQQTPRTSSGSPSKATPRDSDPSHAAQLSVLVLQADALEHDEARGSLCWKSATHTARRTDRQH